MLETSFGNFLDIWQEKLWKMSDLDIYVLKYIAFGKMSRLQCMSESSHYVPKGLWRSTIHVGIVPRLVTIYKTKVWSWCLNHSRFSCTLFPVCRFIWASEFWRCKCLHWGDGGRPPRGLKQSNTGTEWSCSIVVFKLHLEQCGVYSE